jgi:D-alanyl-D-alanine carboxypeptidase/D-alanyl-D-alanine-endopeptidase (penicillin-binding protein 4)
MVRHVAFALSALSIACAGPRPVTSVGPVVTLAGMRHAIDSMVADPKWRTALLRILIVDPERGDTLYSHNAGKLFMPASNQKILTGAVALEALGPDFQFSTSFLADGPLNDGVIEGNLRVVGMGDPSVSDHMMTDAMQPLRALADSLAVRGISRVAGALVPGDDTFPDATLGFGWSWDDLDFAYSAGVDELFFNEGFMRVTVLGGAAPGLPVTVRVAPMRTFPRVRVLARTTGARAESERRPRPTVRHDSTDAGAIIVGGEIAAGDSATVSLTYRDQRRAYLEAVREALTERGIAVDSGVSLVNTLAIGSATPPEPPGILLFSTTSPPLREVLKAFEKPSQNQIGEILLKSLGRARAGVGSADSGARVVRDQLLAWGARPDGFVIRDGSGLSRHNVVTPETIVLVLDAMRRSAHAEVFMAALPIAGVDGTIRNRMRGTAAQGNLRAKTGTLDMVRSLSGYVTTPAGRTLLFSVLANNFRVPNREVELVQDAIGVMLARLERDSR